MSMNHARQRGVSMIEVLVTVVILAIGLLGIAGLQVASVRNTQVAAQRSIATQQAYDIAERIRANLSGATAGAYDALNAGIPGNPGCAPCTAAQQAVVDHWAWNTANQQLLPQGSGTVMGTITGGYLVTLNWVEQTEAGPLAQQFQTVVHP